MSSIITLNNRMNKIFRNPHINFFIIMNIILLITCYTFISSPVKNTISIIISNPVVILFAIIIIIIIGFFDINIAVLLLILFFIALFGIQYNTENTENTYTTDNTYNTGNTNNIENFANNSNTKNNKDKHIYKINNNLQIKAENDKKTDTTVKNIKNVIFKTIDKFRNNNSDDYKNAILENKQIMYKQEQNNNKNKKKTVNNNANTHTKHKNEKFNNVDSNSNNNSNNNNTKTHNYNSNKKYNKDNNDDDNDEENDEDNGNKDNRNVQTIKFRKFDPLSDEDTNLLITKEILQDMNNRIEYNYENNKYLKKYIKHRVEEIVEINNLLNDE